MSDDHSLRARRLLLADRGFALGGGLGHLMALSVEPLIRALDQRLQLGRLSVRLPDGRVRHIGGHKPGPSAEVWLNSWRPVRRYMLGGTLGWSRSYIDGDWDSPDLVAIAELFTTNRYALGKSQKGTRLNRLINRLAHALRANTRRGARRNIAFHYDLGNDFYAARLDSGMTYSSAVFAAGDTLEAAQDRKIRRLLDSLNARPGERLLEIGCGWGGLALYLHQKTGAEVLGVTLSEEQIKVARARAEAAGVADKVKFELIDYRHVSGQFDRIVSVGMFEHVGPPNYRTFFRQCRDLLTPDGVMLIHTIGRMGPPGVTDKWTVKYIFPGGYNPALSEIVAASEPQRMFLTDVEVLRLHYAYTLQHWYDRTTAAKDAIVALYDERFFRMWQFYLAGALCAFKYGGLVNFQLQYARNRHALPITRDYMGDAERVMRG